MKKKKNKKWLATGLICILLVILIILINSSNGNETNTKLNLTEKKWIENTNCI